MPRQVKGRSHGMVKAGKVGTRVTRSMASGSFRLAQQGIRAHGVGRPVNAIEAKDRLKG